MEPQDRPDKLTVMPSLKAVILALRQEINTAMQADVATPHPLNLEVDEIVLSLNLSIKDRKKPDGSLELHFDVQDAISAPSTTAQPPHTLAIKFKVRTSAQNNGHPGEAIEFVEVPVHKAASPPTAPSTEDQLIQSLSEVLGAPGFDSSARATVFREALDGLSDAQALSTMQSFTDPELLKQDDFVKHAHHLISGVLKSGPLKSAGSGGKALAKLFTNHPAVTIVKLVEKNWKTQADWLT